MNLFDAISASSDILTGQIATTVFGILAEDGPAAILVDRYGHCYTSCTDLLAQHTITSDQIKDICSRVDDGGDPVIAKGPQCALVASHLSTPNANYGHFILVLPNYCPVAAKANMDLIETILNAASLAARLLETLSSARTADTPVGSWATHCFN